MPADSTPLLADTPPSFRAMEEAAHWYAALRCDDASTTERASWSAWLEADPQHRNAWAYVENISRQFEPLQRTHDPRNVADNLLLANSRVRRRQVLRCLGVLAVSGAGWSSWRLTPLPLWGSSLIADYRTGMGELRRVDLQDGTKVWLNTASALNIDFSGAIRALQLVMGEVYIETGHDAQRPFIVSTASGQLRALGTEFTVRSDGHSTFLAVFGGAVQVRTAVTGQTRVVSAGQQLVFDSEQSQPDSQVDPARRAWSRGMLVAVDITLREVVQELSRYRFGHLAVAPEVADLKVFGNLPLQDVDKALSILASSLPISIEHTLPWWTTVKAKRKDGV